MDFILLNSLNILVKIMLQFLCSCWALFPAVCDDFLQYLCLMLGDL